MASLPLISHIAPERVQVLNDRARKEAGTCVLYWMQASQRAEENDALEYAAGLARELKLPLVAGFGLMDDYPGANLRHYQFMLEGLAEVAATLERRGVEFVLQHGAPAQVALRLGREAAVIVCDRGYTRHQRAWREEVAAGAGCPVVQVEADVIVPVQAASPKLEFAARTIRPKLNRLLEKFLPLPEPVRLEKRAAPKFAGPRLDPSDPAALAGRLKLDRKVGPVTRYFHGGTAEAKRRFRDFCQTRLAHYQGNRAEPAAGNVSHLSAYLHFGQVSPRWLVHEIRRTVEEHPRLRRDADAWVEELLVRRELGMNFVYYQPQYDSFAGVPQWARTTLAEHERDARPHRYTHAQLAAGRTHDPYWNAAQREMRVTGYMHNHLRMYWGKKLLEWAHTPEEGFQTTLELNNTYFLCGRDPASYANVAWVYGLHDRPWGEREIYGKVRCMMASGLERKADIKAYVEWTSALEEAGEGSSHS